jgi:hypothetical protein
VTASQAGSRGGTRIELDKRQETLLAVLGQERTGTYTNTREAVLRLKHPIRGR